MTVTFDSGPERRSSLRSRLFRSLRISDPASGSADSDRESTAVETQDDGDNRSMYEERTDCRTRLLESYYRHEPLCGSRVCDHGTFSPRPASDSSVKIFGCHGSSSLNEVARSENGDSNNSPEPSLRNKTLCVHKLLPCWCLEVLTFWFFRYLSYYVPLCNWITQYRWSFFRGDLVAALTVASIYIPMALSLSSNLAHAPAINGLYSYVFNPVIYAILGSSPMLVVGPEAAGSLLVGTIVKSSVRQGHSPDDDDVANAMVVGVATALAGSMILIAGITRLGFLDNVLSRPFLRGFITAVGCVILVDQLVAEMGLTQRAKEVGNNVLHGSTIEKLVFLVKNAGFAHHLTAAVSVGSFVIIMVFR